MVRGVYPPHGLRSAFRKHSNVPAYRINSIGFRVARALESLTGGAKEFLLESLLLCWKRPLRDLKARVAALTNFRDSSFLLTAYSTPHKYLIKRTGLAYLGEWRLFPRTESRTA